MLWTILDDQLFAFKSLHSFAILCICLHFGISCAGMLSDAVPLRDSSMEKLAGA
jgi:hypothetical protein